MPELDAEHRDQMAALTAFHRCSDLHAERHDMGGAGTCAACRSWGAHLAAALLPLIREREAAAWERALREVRTLADEWKAEGGSLVMHAYSGRDVHEGQTLERCAYELRDRAADNPYAGSEGA